MWDLRKNYTAYHRDPVPMQSYPYAGSSTRMRLGQSCDVCTPERCHMSLNDLNYLFDTLQATLDLFWTLPGPTSCVTAQMTTFTCSVSVE